MLRKKAKATEAEPLIDAFDVDDIPLATGPVAFTSMEEINRYINRWKEVLNLRDWDFETRVVPNQEMPNQDCNFHAIGGCAANRTDCRTVLFLCTPDTYKYQTAFSQYQPVYDMELTLVHEMLHVKFNTDWVEHELPDSMGSRWKDTLEFVVEQSAKSLVALERALRKENYGEVE